MSDAFFKSLKAVLKTPFPCASCTNPLCSCSGAEKANAMFLPGERSWIERTTGKKWEKDGVRIGNDNGFPVCGDCPMLAEDYSCSLGAMKPWDGESFPLQPELVSANGRWTFIPMFAKNCSVHPADVPREWLAERIIGWEMILNELKRTDNEHWMLMYSMVPAHE